MTIVAAWAAPAAAERYDAKQNGDVVDLVDADAQMNVSVVWNMCNAWRIQVRGKDLVRTSATLADFQARPGFNGMPFLAPFANRNDWTKSPRRQNALDRDSAAAADRRDQPIQILIRPRFS